MSTSESGPKFRVAICGAGIGGLVLAITIGKYDPSIPIDLYEAHDSIETAGVGITIWRQANDVLTELGLFDDFKQIFSLKPESNRGPDIRRADIPQGGYLWYQRDYRYAPTSAHRQQMVAILEKRLPPLCTVHSKKRLVNYVELEQQQDAHIIPHIRLEFADGTTANTDVLIGADGIRSAVRKTLFETASSEEGEANLRQYADAVFTGMVSYRFLIPAEELRKEDPGNRTLNELHAYCGKGRYLIAFPIANGTIVNVAVAIGDSSLKNTYYEGRWVSEATREEVAYRFDDFEPEVRALMKFCQKPSKWALHVTKPLPFCVRKRVALVGDACHAMTPFLGAGAGQAIDDAFVLGRLIAHPLATLSRIPDVLRIYEEIRLAFAQTMAHYSLSTGWMCMFMEPGYYDGAREGEGSDLDERGIGAKEKEGVEVMKQEILSRWETVDESPSAVHTWEDTERKLRALVGPRRAS